MHLITGPHHYCLARFVLMKCNFIIRTFASIIQPTIVHIRPSTYCLKKNFVYCANSSVTENETVFNYDIALSAWSCRHIYCTHVLWFSFRVQRQVHGASAMGQTNEHDGEQQVQGHPTDTQR